MSEEKTIYDLVSQIRQFLRVDFDNFLDELVIANLHQLKKITEQERTIAELERKLAEARSFYEDKERMDTLESGIVPIVTGGRAEEPPAISIIGNVPRQFSHEPKRIDAGLGGDFSGVFWRKMSWREFIDLARSQIKTPKQEPAE